MEPQDPKLPGGVTGAEIDKHLDGGDPVDVDEDTAIELAWAEFDSKKNRAVYYFDPQPCEDQNLELDKDGQVGVKFEFTVWVDYPCIT